VGILNDEIRSRIPKLGRDIARRVSFGLGRTNKKPVDHPLFDSPLWQEAGTAHLKSMAAQQLGTVGSGNHYVDLFRDEDDWIWVGLHFGSRGLGHKTATQFLKAAGGRDGMDVPPALVEADSELGRRYIAGMTLAGDYAYAGREWVVEEVRRMLGAGIVDTVHNHHNYAWRERHGQTVLVAELGGAVNHRENRAAWAADLRQSLPVLRRLRLPVALWAYTHGGAWRLQPGEGPALHPEFRGALNG